MFGLCRRHIARCLFTTGRHFLTTRAVGGAPTRFAGAGHVLIRGLTTPPPQVKGGTLELEAYHSLSDTTMEILLDSLEGLLDDVGNSEYEVDYHSGVLTLVLGDKGTYVINKQPPNQQIWLSSPFSGPKRYDYSPDHDDWVYSRDGVAMGQLLDTELTKAFGRTVDLGISSISALAS